MGLEDIATPDKPLESLTGKAPSHAETKVFMDR